MGAACPRDTWVTWARVLLPDGRTGNQDASGSDVAHPEGGEVEAVDPDVEAALQASWQRTRGAVGTRHRLHTCRQWLLARHVWLYKHVWCHSCCPGGNVRPMLRQGLSRAGPGLPLLPPVLPMWPGVATGNTSHMKSRDDAGDILYTHLVCI